jgi:transcriptional regulator with XRE-family HTH domain
MARAALGWTLDALAAASGVNRKTILRFERQEVSARPATLEALRRALETAGARFTEDGGVFPPPREGTKP